MTMVELAERANMQQGHLSRLERGHLPYNQQTLERLAEALRVSPGMLIDVDPEKS